MARQYMGLDGVVVNEQGDREYMSLTGVVMQEDQAAVAAFVPYPNPRYVMTGGMQPMQGGV